MTLFLFLIWYIYYGEYMKVKIFDENHEKDLEKDINLFISEYDYEIKDIQFRTSVSIFGEEQIYCFSAMIIYKE